MTILHIITRRQLRGAEIFASQLSAEFVRRGHSVIVVALQSAKQFPKIEGVEYIDLNTDPSQRWFAFSSWRKLSRIICDRKPDIIQANASETLKFSVFSRLLFRWKTLLVYRNANKASDFIRSAISRTFNAWLANQVDHVISVSESCRRDFEKTFNVPERKITTIPIGTVLDNASQNIRLPLPADQFWINVASLVPEKNHHGLLKIFKAYKNRGGSSHLLVVGDGRLKENLLKQSYEMGLADDVHFLGYRQDVIAIMQRAHGLLLPSHIEGLPGVILEAMGCKIPVIAYDVGGIGEVIHDHITGFLIEKDNEQRFANQMITLEIDSEIRSQVAAQAYALCSADYRIEVIAERFLRKYQDIINDRV